MTIYSNQVKALVNRFPNMTLRRAADMTTAKMLRMFDYPAPEKLKRRSEGHWQTAAGPPEGTELGAVFDEEKLPRPLLEAIQEFARAALEEG